MACGGNYTIFLTEKQELFGLGSNADGRMGQGASAAGSATATFIEFPKGKSVKQIACGVNHSIILTTEQKMYMAGHNDLG